jgi:hypothetical protein
MKLALLIVSIGTLIVIGVAVIGHALVVTQVVTYTPTGQIANPTPLAVVATFMDAVGSGLAMPLCLVTAVLGLVATAGRAQYGWLAAVVVAGVLALVGLVGMAYIILDANVVVPFVAPLAVVPLVTVLYAARMPVHGIAPAR